MVKLCSRQSRIAARSEEKAENELRSLHGNISSEIEEAQLSL